MREARISIVNTRVAGIELDDAAILSMAEERIDSIGRDRPDIILLAELFANHAKDSTPESAQAAAQSVPGPISEQFSRLAKKHHSYIAFGLLRRDGERLFNSLVLLGRDGKHVWTYDKMTPVPGEMECCDISPGGIPESYRCDFGRIGGVICFDINFMELAEIYSRQDVELLLFSSAFPAGRLLDIWAVRYGFNIAGSTWYSSNRVIDCTGSTVGRTSDLMPCATTVLNLNRRVVHMDGNMEKLDAMRSKYAGDVLVEDMRDEAVCVITGLKKGLEVNVLIEEFQIERLSDYFDRARRTREAFGGAPSPTWHSDKESI